MKIGFICTEMLPSPSIRGGAIQILIDGIAPYISRNHELTVFSITDPELPEKENKDRVEYVRFPKGEYVTAVADYLQNNRPFDVIHVFNRPKNVHTYKAATPSTKFILSVHNEMFHPKKISDEAALKCINSVEEIMTVSDYIGTTISKRFPVANRKLKTVYSGADLNRYSSIWQFTEKRNLMRKDYGFADKKVILFVGRLSEKKGPHILIEAFKNVIAKHPEAQLVIVGGRWFSDDTVDRYVKQLYQQSEPVQDKIMFTKFVPPADMPDLYLMSDIFVCASPWQEPLARVHYEAMAAGLPVITTDRGGNTEIIRDYYNGIVVKDYSNPDAFTQALETLLSNPGLAFRLGKRGWNFARKFCNFSRVAGELVNIYERCAGKRR